MASETSKVSVLPESLLAELEVTARAQGRSVPDVLCDAVSRYIEDQKWKALVTRGEQRARSKGLSEADVPRLIEELRSENKSHRL